MKFTSLSVALGAAGALALGVALAPTGAVAGGHAKVEGPKVSWKMSLWGKRRAFTEGMESVSEQVSKRTGGKFQINPGETFRAA